MRRSAAIQNSARDEIAKDVLAFANSDRGVLLYGVEEKDQLPLKIDDGVEDAKYSREWIEFAILNGITPRIPNAIILPLAIWSVTVCHRSDEVIQGFSPSPR
jgi:predicted HTH transcriptional regulator